jgi:Domain of unknown function (DUF397)
LNTPHHAEDTELTWHKARRSNAGNDCVEIARTPVGHLIRDSKHPYGPRLPLRDGTWAALIDDIKNGEYELKEPCP